MTTRTILIIALFFYSFYCDGQTLNLYDKHIRDSLCTYGKKYTEPERKKIDFPAKQVSDDKKLAAFHKALPDSFNNEDNDNWWYYQYYLGEGRLLDYDPIGDSTFVIKDKQKQILQDTYFFDVNGDGLLDFIHYPKYYKALAHDLENYEIFIQQTDGFKMLRFSGYIIDIDYNKNGTLNKMTTFFPECCANDQCTFLYYIFDKQNNTLTLINSETLLVCQLIRRQR